jgi:hemoglobin/transferrin/lactoferrin receptor protein
MKPITFLWVLLLFVIGSTAQNNIRIADEVTLAPISGANVKDAKGVVLVSGPKGIVNISPLDLTDTITISHTGYFPVKIKGDALLKVPNGNVFLSQRIINLEEFVFSANKSPEMVKDIPHQIEVIDSRSVEFGNPQTSADMLTNSGSVFVQKSQMGGGSPVLRGFEANKVLLVVDGVRMNNIIYRGGHLQDVITIDPMMLDRTEVVFGPGSVIYGSDALGGVMHFYTRNPEFGADSFLVKGNTMIRWSSANDEMTGHANFNLGWKRFSSLTGISYSDFDDLRSGNQRDAVYDQGFVRPFYVETFNGKDSMVRNPDRNIQKQSAYKQYGLFQKFQFKQKEGVLHRLNLQYSNSSDVPRYDRLSEYSGGNLKFAEWYYGPQLRGLAAYSLVLENPSRFYDNASITLAYQRSEQIRVSRRFKNPNRRTQTEEVNVMSLNADFHKKAGERHEFRYGLEGLYNGVNSTAKSENITTGEVKASATRYPDGENVFYSGSAYLSHSFEINDKWILSDGIRVGYYSLNASFQDTTFFKFPFREVSINTTTWSGNAGLVWLPGKGWKISLLGGTGYRVPNLDDLAKVFDSSPGYLVVPNDDIKSEVAYNAELGISKNLDDRVRISGNLWYTLLQNAIVVAPFQYQGKDTVDYFGIPSKVVASQNADQANIMGWTGTVQFVFDRNFSLNSTLTYTYGRYHSSKPDTIVPMDHIPPVYGQTSLLYRSGKTEGEFFVRYNGWKDIKDYSPSGEDNLSYATPYGMPSWVTLNARIAFQMSKSLRAILALENILDTHYRYFASGISAPGRNLIVSVRSRF